MKKLTFILAIGTTLYSCTKKAVSPANSQATAESTSTNVLSTNNSLRLAATQPTVTFKPSTSSTVNVSSGLNTLQTDSFYVSGDTAALTSLNFIAHGSINLSAFKFYVNGGQVMSTITYYNDSIINVALRRPSVLPVGNYNYILQAKTLGTSGSSLSIKLKDVIVVDRNRFNVPTFNLPSATDILILN